MDPNIVTKGEMVLVGLISQDKVNGNYPDICKLWSHYSEKENGIENRVEGVSYEMHRFLPERVEVTVAAEVSKVGAVPEGLSVARLPAGQYAVFTHRLANGGFEGLNPVMDNWLKTGAYEQSDNFIIELHDARFKDGKQPDSEIDFLIPIKPRS